MFGGKDRWTKRAVLLAEVLHIYEDSLCRECGMHSALAFDPFNTGHFAVDDSTVCLGCEALQRHVDKDPWPGTKVAVVHDFE